MLKQIAIFNGNHAAVSRYYSQGEWHQATGDVPVVVLATPARTDLKVRRGKKRGQREWTLTSDVEAGGVYDECGYLMGYDDPSVTFEELEAAAKAANWYGHGTYDRRVLIFVGGREPLRPALITFAGNQPFRWEESERWVVESLDRRFAAEGRSPANAMEVHRKTVLFEFDAEEEPSPPTEAFESSPNV